MNTWIPLWSSTVDSTLWEEPKDVRILFLTMLMMQDPDHIVRVPLRVLAKKANLSADKEEAYRLAQEALKVLESPDERSQDNQEFGGRRVKLTEDGHWLMLNAEKYVEQMRTLWSRMRKSQKQRERRDRERAGLPTIPASARPNVPQFGGANRTAAGEEGWEPA